MSPAHLPVPKRLSPARRRALGALCVALCLAVAACNGDSESPIECKNERKQVNGDQVDLCRANCVDAWETVQGWTRQVQANIDDLRKNNADGRYNARIAELEAMLVASAGSPYPPIQKAYFDALDSCHDMIFTNHSGSDAASDTNRDGACRCPTVSGMGPLAGPENDSDQNDFDQTTKEISDMFPDKINTSTSDFDAIATNTAPSPGPSAVPADNALKTSGGGSSSGSPKPGNLFNLGSAGKGGGLGSGGGGGGGDLGGGAGSGSLLGSRGGAGGASASGRDPSLDAQQATEAANAGGKDSSGAYSGGSGGAKRGSGGGGGDSVNGYDLAALFGGGSGGANGAGTGANGVISFGAKSNGRDPASGGEGDDAAGARMSADDYLRLNVSDGLFERATKVHTRKATQWALNPASRAPASAPTRPRAGPPRMLGQ